MPTQEPPAESGNLTANFLSAVAASAGQNAPSTTDRERRLDLAFNRFNAKRSLERGGHRPNWTATLRAEVWAAFAIEGRSLVRQSGVPAPDRGFDLEAIPDRFPTGYRRMAKALMALLDEDGKTIAVCGTRGTGKSTLAWGLVLKFCDLCRPAKYATVAEMFNQLSNAPWEEKEKIRRSYLLPDLLVLDEVQVRDDRSWQDNELITLIDSRYREDRSTLLLSNLDPVALKENLGDSIWRRLTETGGPPLMADWPRIEELKAKWKREEEGAARQKIKQPSTTATTANKP